MAPLHSGWLMHYPHIKFNIIFWVDGGFPAAYCKCLEIVKCVGLHVFVKHRATDYPFSFLLSTLRPFDLCIPSQCARSAADLQVKAIHLC